MKIGLRYFFFGSRTFSWASIEKISLKINLRIKTNNPKADLYIRYLTKLILKPYGRNTAIPTAWELTRKLEIFFDLTLLVWIAYLVVRLLEHRHSKGTISKIFRWIESHGQIRILEFSNMREECFDYRLKNLSITLRVFHQ